MLPFSNEGAKVRNILLHPLFCENFFNLLLNCFKSDFYVLFWKKFDEWDNHFFQRNAAVLERILVIIDIIGVVVGISKEGIARGKNEG